MSSSYDGGESGRDEKENTAPEEEYHGGDREDVRAGGHEEGPAAPERQPESAHVSGIAAGLSSDGYKNPWQEPIYSPLRTGGSGTSGAYSPSYHSVGSYPGRRPVPSDKKSGRHTGRAILFLLLCVALCASAGAGGAYLVTDYMLKNNETPNQVVFGSDTTDTADTADSEGVDNTAASGDTLTGEDIYALGCKQVVGIKTSYTTTNAFGQTSSSAVTGSGFIISKDGYILTNYHVIEYALAYDYDLQVIFFDGTSYDTEIIGYDKDNDIAVVKVDATGLDAVSFGTSLYVGETVYAIGNPLGELTYSMTSGIVSALDRVISTDESTAINMFQFDAAVNPGNSGGPVYNSRGQVIGIATAKYSTGASASTNIEGIGFAIPISDAVDIASELVENGYVSGKAYLGITVQDVTDSVAQYFNMPKGAYIYSVTSGSCAELSGLKVGDVITAIDSSTVDSVEALKTILKQRSAGETVVITIYRSGSYQDITVVLDENVPEGYSGS